jgi:hypothetical protein
MLLSVCGLSRHVIHFLQPFWQTMLNPQDLSFVGYTYKNFDAVKGLHHSFGMRILHNPCSIVRCNMLSAKDSYDIVCLFVTSGFSCSCR